MNNNIIINPGSVITTKLTLYYKDQILSHATGFFYEINGYLNLITNLHNVTGRHTISKEPISSHGGIPDRVKLTILEKGYITQWKEVFLLLYEDAKVSEQPQVPIWKIHPVFLEKTDVVSIPIVSEDDLDIYPANTMNTTNEMQITVSDDVFVLGYPKGISGGGAYPIWKRASIASEPDLNLEGLPKNLIDTATREGMSGSPVIAKSSGGYTHTNGDRVVGTDGSKLLGVYSGRVGKGEFEAQLGIVWKLKFIEEIIKGNKTGISSFSM